MLTTIEDTLNKTCLIGLSYFNVQGEQLKQNIIAGRVIKVDSEMGITIELSSLDNTLAQSAEKSEKVTKGHNPHFILPTNLSCWFNAPEGEFHTSQNGVTIISPDYLVTWDIHQLKDQKSRQQGDETSQNSEQQWWQWRPRIQSPNVG